MKSKSCILLFCFIAISICISSAKQDVEQWHRFEIALPCSLKANGFKYVNVSATFVSKDTTYTVAGFYDGDNTFKIRFMPQKTGSWNYTTKSNIPDLNNKKGSFECITPTGENHGIVRVSNTYNFKYADGKQYYPFGTTAYAWTHMPNDVQEKTLKTLKNSGFNK